MRLIRICSFDRSFSSLKRAGRYVATIGNFDGLHLGHQALINQVLEQGLKLGLGTRIILFEPQPEEYLNPINAPARLMNFSEKLAQLKQYGIDEVICLRFNKQLATLSALAFIEQLLIKQLGIVYLVVGSDFRFGHARAGDIHLLQMHASANTYMLKIVEPILLNGRKISSTWVREILRSGALSEAKALLGRPFSMSGRVQQGDGRGKTFGFATANIFPKRLRLPLTGVYLVKVRLQSNLLYGIANVGRRPTVDGLRDWLEVHLFDFSHTIYGKRLSVTFIDKLRDEKCFESIEALKKQIAIDVETAKDYFQLQQ